MKICVCDRENKSSLKGNKSMKTMCIRGGEEEHEKRGDGEEREGGKGELAEGWKQRKSCRGKGKMDLRQRGRGQWEEMRKRWIGAIERQEGEKKSKRMGS